MASCRQSAITPGLAGSIGSTTFRNGRTGLVIQQRAIQTGQASSNQLRTRARLAILASAWRGLDAATHAAWTNAGRNYNVRNRVGEQITLTGFQLFIRVNMTRATIALAPTTDVLQTVSVIALATPPFFADVYGEMYVQFDAIAGTLAANAAGWCRGARTWSTLESAIPTWGEDIDGEAFYPANTALVSLTGIMMQAFGYPLPPDGEWIHVEAWAHNPGRLDSAHFFLKAQAYNIH